MINHIIGKFKETTPSNIIIENGGIGYFVSISLHTYEKIKDLNEGKILIQQIIKEDAHLLFGFANEEERALFKLLITVSGVGANTARLMLSAIPPNELKQAIISNDENTLKKIKGIGLKTAQRIIIDLKDKIIKGDDGKEIISSSHNTIKEEALSALLMLGFNKASAEKAILKIIKNKGETLTVENLIKEALKIL